MDKEVVKELIQKELTTDNLKNELSLILSGDNRERILDEYHLLRERLGGSGASDEAANIIVS